MRSLTPAQITAIKETLTHARIGRATLTQLAAAHDLAEDAGINGTIGELRFHIRHMVKPPPMQAEAKGLLLGVASGILTHYLLDSFYRERAKY